MYETMHHPFGSGSIDDDDSPTEEAQCNGTTRSEFEALMKEAQYQVTAKREEHVSMEQAQCTGTATNEDDVSMEEVQCTGTATSYDDASTEETRCNGSPTSDDSASDGTTNTAFSSLAIGDLPLPTRVSKAGPPADPLAQQKGKIEWVHGYFYAESPEWRCEIDTAIIKEIVEPQLEAHGFGTKDVSIEFFAAGGLNKLYTVTATVGETGEKRECIFRVAMPLDPWYKTESEVATIEYVRRHTSIPVPKVYSYDSSTENKLGFEWIMMEKMAGKPLFEFWDVDMFTKNLLDMATKLQLARTVAEWVHQLSKFSFDVIGSLYIDWDKPEPCFKIGRIVEGSFFRGRRLGYKVFRGPFKNLEQHYQSEIGLQLQEIYDPVQREALEARLVRIEHAKKAEAEALEKQTEEGKSVEKTSGGRFDWDHVEDEADWYREADFIRIPKACHALLSVLPIVLSKAPVQVGSNMLSHRDMSFKNLLLDDFGTAVGLVDWEMTVANPCGTIRCYPDVVDTDGCNLTVLQPWTGGEKDLTRLHQETLNQQTLMAKEFRSYLEDKKSRWLRNFTEWLPVTSQLQRRVYEIPSNATRMDQWVKCIEEGTEWEAWREY